MGQLVLKFLLSLFGLISVLIATSIFLQGPHATAQISSAILDRIVGTIPVVTDLNSISIDSELRFYSALFFVFGLICIHTGVNLPKNSKRVYIIAAVILLGGFGRAWSNISVGAPNPLFVFLMWVELIFPIIIAVLARRLARKNNGF